MQLRMDSRAPMKMTRRTLTPTTALQEKGGGVSVSHSSLTVIIHTMLEQSGILGL